MSRASNPWRIARFILIYWWGLGRWVQAGAVARNRDVNVGACPGRGLLRTTNASERGSGGLGRVAVVAADDFG